MQSNLGRVVLGIAVVAIAVVLLIVLKDDGGDDDAGSSGAATTTEQTGSGRAGENPGEPREPSVPTIVVKGGQPVGGVEELTFEAGEQIRFAVRSDTSDEVHVHGYDIEKEVEPGKVVRFDFPASIEGVFEAELHESGEQIVELRIEP